MLYIVGTPIGNLDEITYRAVEVLKNADLIAAEDTRHTLTLLNRYGIKSKLISYRKFNEKASCNAIIEMLKEGKNIALVSDAGMPLISDPGWILVKELIENNLEYTVISGPCAAISALVLSGMDTSAFVMLGFLPEKKSDKDRLLNKYKDIECTLIFYSAPHDIKKHLEYLHAVLGQRNVAIVREISKIHEEVIRGALGDAFDIYEKGEFVIVVEGKNPSDEYKDLCIMDHYKKYVNLGLSHNDAMKKVAFDRKISKSIVYKEILSSGTGVDI